MFNLHYFPKLQSQLAGGLLIVVSHFCYADTTLQTFENIEQYPATEGNSLRLAKLKQGCKIEAQFYGELGRVKENYLFQQRQLNYAARYEYTYADGGLSNLSDNQGKFKTQQKRIELDPEAAKTRADFQEYLSLFSRNALKKCH